MRPGGTRAAGGSAARRGPSWRTSSSCPRRRRRRRRARRAAPATPRRARRPRRSSRRRSTDDVVGRWWPSRASASSRRKRGHRDHGWHSGRELRLSVAMDFELSDELAALRDSVRRLAQDKIKPRAREIDSTGEYPQDFFDEFRTRGPARAVHPRGVRRVGRGDPRPRPGDRGGHQVLQRLRPHAPAHAPADGPGDDRGDRGPEAALPAGHRATATQRAAFCLSEPGAGSDVAGMTHARRRRPRRRRRLRAQRDQVLDLGGHAGRLVHVVFAKTGDPASRAHTRDRLLPGRRERRRA